MDEDFPDLPHGIGPHEGRELELMLAGEKPLAMFSDVVPSAYEFPDDDFEPHVAAGAIVKHEEFGTTSDGHTVRHLYFALPDEAWRIAELHRLVTAPVSFAAPGLEDYECQVGRLLGYSDAEIRTFVDWARRKRP